MDTKRVLDSAHQSWAAHILPILEQYIALPNVSPAFDPKWKENDYMGRVVELLADWAREQPLPGLTVKVVRLEGRTPLICIEVPSTGAEGTVLLYGHCDKQPGMDEKWREGLSPWTPVIEGDRLYGRGAADDGYAIFAALTALRLLEEQSVPHARCVVLIEADEESGSEDLPAYVEHLAPSIGTPDLVICLDSGCGNYDQLWMTTSLRGLVGGKLRVDVLTEGVHSGSASGIVPSSFLILIQLLSRLINISTGRVLIDARFDALRVKTPPERVNQAIAMVEALGESAGLEFPWVSGISPMDTDPVQRLLARTWRPALSFTGADGLPALTPVDMAGNVLRPSTTLKLSMRIPPGVDPQVAVRLMKETLERDPPYGAHVSLTPEQTAAGWNAPTLAPWLAASVDSASRAFFSGKPVMAMGEGGTIPFIQMLVDRFPAAQFLITGLIGPDANAHGPNEYLHLPTAERLTAVVAQVIADHARR